MLHSETAERQLLGYVLHNPSRFPDFALEGDEFYYESYRYLWREMRAQWQAHQDFSPFTLTATFEAQGVDADWLYLMQQLMLEHAYTQEPLAFQTVITNAYARRQILTLTDDLSKLAHSQGDLNPQELAQTVMNAVNTHLKELDSKQPTTGISTLDAGNQLLADFYDPNPDARALRTGIPGFDRALGGGYDIGHHGILASSGTGKTILLSNLAYEFGKQGANVLYVLMESNAQFIMRRLVARYMKINPDYLRRQQVPPGYDPEDFRLELAEAVNDIGTRININILVKTLHVDTWRQVIDAEIRRWGKEPDVLIIDYGQKVSHHSKQSPIEAHTLFGNELTEYSVNEQRYVFTALQVRKEGNAGLHRPPTANDIRGTSNWFNVFDTLVSLFRDPLESGGDHVGYSTEGLLSFVKLRDTDSAAPVPVTLVSDGLFFAELEGAR